MKISETTSYPHPVLTPWSHDITGATFSVDIKFRERLEQRQVDIHCKVELDHPDILSLISSRHATFGCYMQCLETGLRRVQSFDFPVGTHEFAPGAMLGRVQIRPMIWAATTITDYAPAGSHPEFTGTFCLAPGDMIALGDVQTIDVTRPPLPAMESIFEIKLSRDVEEGIFNVDPGSDRIAVHMAEHTHRLVQELRQTNEASKTVVMNALYVPVVMEVLDQLHTSGSGQFEQHRWYHPFLARCEAVGIDTTNPDLLNDAQKLLEKPFASLKCLTGEQE